MVTWSHDVTSAGWWCTSTWIQVTNPLMSQQLWVIHEVFLAIFRFCTILEAMDTSLQKEWKRHTDSRQETFRSEEFLKTRLLSPHLVWWRWDRSPSSPLARRLSQPPPTPWRSASSSARHTITFQSQLALSFLSFKAVLLRRWVGCLPLFS